MSANRGIPRRSERPSPEVSTKEAILLIALMVVTLLALRSNFPLRVIKSCPPENQKLRCGIEGDCNE